MANITVIGGTGYAGSAIVAEAAKRGHHVTAISRNAPADPMEGVTYVQGSALDPALQARAFEGADFVISTTSPRGDMAGQVLELNTALSARAAETGVQLAVVGGYMSLRQGPGAPRYAEGQISERFRAEALEGFAVLEALVASKPAADWIFISPAANFGAYAPGEATGRYRLGGDVALRDENGVSAISAPDFALALLDAIESDDHHRAHISAAY